MELEGVTLKVMNIFQDLVGPDRVEHLNPCRLSVKAMDVIIGAFYHEYGVEKANEISFHLADWNWDAAFIVALQLYPELFSKEEIREGIGIFLSHAPNHIREACRLTGTYVWENFPEV